jgi:hypothetical protein
MVVDRYANISEKMPSPASELKGARRENFKIGKAGL